MAYEIIAEHKWEEIIHYQQYGWYAGERILVTEKDWVLKVYKDYYGSCTGCDDYERTFNDIDSPEKDSEEYKETVKKFVSEYSPFLERKISDITKQDIEDSIMINNKDIRNFDKEEQEKLIKKLCDKYIR